MDSSSEYQEAPQAPETRADKISAITTLIQGQDDDIDAGQDDSANSGPEVQKPAVRGDNSGPGALDLQESDPETGVDADIEGTEAAADVQDNSEINIGALADHLGVEAADVYELEVPIGDGVTATLGQLKDEFKEYGPAKEYQATLHQERGDFEKSVMQTRAELNAIVNAIPPEMRDSVINAGRQHQAQWSKDQETAVLEAIPEWADADRRATDRAHLIEDGSEYGFSEAEITYTQDARTLRMLRDFSTMKRELQEMRSAAKREPGKANPPGRPVHTNTAKRKLAQALKRAKSDPTIQGKAAAVSALIRNQ